MQSTWLKWSRYFAKIIDSAIVVGAFYTVLKLIKTLDFDMMPPTAVGFVFIYFLMTVIYEGIAIFRWNTTIGKVLFGISVVSDRDNEKINLWSSIKRSLMCSLVGNAFGIPLLSFITGIFAYLSLSSQSQSVWDIQSRTKVIQRNSPLEGVGLFVALVIVALTIFYQFGFLRRSL